MKYEKILKLLGEYSGRMKLEDAYTLERIEAFMEHIGNPQEKYPVIHVAGTSGKTSTCYYISYLLAGEGKKVGLSISPHLVDVRERTQVNNQILSKMAYADYFSQFYSLVKSFDKPLSYFELLVAFSYWVFAKEKVDFAVIETGLGGMLDATNVVKSPHKTCVITSIGLDHQAILGDTKEKIAVQKAGIIQPKNAVYVFPQDENIFEIFHDRAESVKATTTRIKSTTGNFLLKNAYAATQVVSDILGYVVDAGKALEYTIPGRFEVHRIKDKTYIFDGAHNSQKIEALIEAYKGAYPQQRPLLVFGILQTKRASLEAIVGSISQLVDAVYTIDFTNDSDLHHDSVDSNELAEMFTKQGIEAQATLIRDLKSAVEDRKEEVILVTGSLYMLDGVKKSLI